MAGHGTTLSSPTTTSSSPFADRFGQRFAASTCASNCSPDASPPVKVANNSVDRVPGPCCCRRTVVLPTPTTSTTRNRSSAGSTIAKSPAASVPEFLSSSPDAPEDTVIERNGARLPSCCSAYPANFTESVDDVPVVPPPHDAKTDVTIESASTSARPFTSSVYIAFFPSS